MMKKAFSIALAAFALIAAPSFAQNTQNVSADSKANTEKTCDLGKSRKFRKADMKTMEGRRADRALEGINLTETQKKEVSALNERTHAERQAMKAECLKIKAERKADKAADREQRMVQRKAMKEKRIAAKKSYLSQLRNIIGDDNYVIYLENQYIQKYDNGNRAKMHAGHAKRSKAINKDGRHQKMKKVREMKQSQTATTHS